jgi:hypothetical protein
MGRATITCKKIGRNVLYVLCVLAITVSAMVFPAYGNVAYAAKAETEQQTTFTFKYARAIKGGEALEVVNRENKIIYPNSVVMVVGEHETDYVLRINNRYFLYPKMFLEIIPSDNMDLMILDLFGSNEVAAAVQQLPTLEEVLRNAVREESLKYIGYPYVWGAKGPDAFDCSGFVRWVYKEAIGYMLPNGSFIQDDTPVLIDVGEVQQGDLIFFKSGERGRRLGVNHVGIYDKNNYMTEAKGEDWGVVTGPLRRRPVKAVSPIKYIISTLPTAKERKAAIESELESVAADAQEKDEHPGN